MLSMNAMVLRRFVASMLYYFQVYWLSINYLVVAKSALVSTSLCPSNIRSSFPPSSFYNLCLCILQICGSYFTSVLYVEHWCEEHFGNLTLGSPDFSPQEEVNCFNISSISSEFLNYSLAFL